ncbi:Collagen alpha-1(XII) chain, partial [Chelonia mydas]
ADILFLVGESWSVGEGNFRLIKDFVYSVVLSFENVAMGKEGVRLGVALYAEKPRMSIELTDYVTIEEVLVAVRELSFQGGSAKTGDALVFVAHVVFSPAAARGDAAKIVLDGNKSTMLVADLNPDTNYFFPVLAVYADALGESTAVKGKTMKLLPVKSILLQNETTDTIQARWTSVRGASGYRLTWVSAGTVSRNQRRGSVETVNLDDTCTDYMIPGLQPGLEYTVTVNPVFGDVEGPVVSRKATTLAASAVQTLKVTDVTINSALLAWNSVAGAAGYRVAWGPTPDRPRQLALNSSTTAYQLRNLAPDSEYVISLYVLFGSAEGPGITASARTSPLGYVSNFKVTSYTSTSISLAWRATAAATGYRISWSPGGAGRGRGVAKSQYLGSRGLAYHIDHLLPNTHYTLGVRAMFNKSEGPEVTLTHRTDSNPIQTVRDLQIVDIGVNSLKVSWKKTPGVTHYKISWVPFSGGLETSRIVPAEIIFFTITKLQESTTYTIRVSSMIQEREGSPVLLSAKTPTTMTLRMTPATTVVTTKASPPLTTLSGPICGKFKADIAFLVDESSSIGQSNFNKVKEFLYRIVSYFPRIGPEGTQIAVAQYSEEPRTEFHFNQHKDRNGALRALKELQYTGGNTKTGRGLGYVLKELFQSSKGMRPTVPRTLVLVTDGQSQDDVLPPARVAHALGIRVIAVGVSRADPQELNSILLHRNLQNVFYISTFEDFPHIIREVIETICSDSPHSGAQPQPGEVSCFLLHYFHVYALFPTASSPPRGPFWQPVIVVLPCVLVQSKPKS